MSEEILNKATGNAVGSPEVSPGDMGTVLVGTGTFAGDISGGVLNPEQSRRFVDYIFDSMVLAKDGRRVTLQSNTAEIDKVQVGERLVAKATQATDTGVNSTPQFTKVEVVTTKFRLDYEVSTEALEDNIEGAGFEDSLVRLMATQFGSDLEDIAINGVTGAGTGNQYGSTIDGFVQKITSATAGGEHFAAAAAFKAGGVGAPLENGSIAPGEAIGVFSTLYNNLDRKFKSRRGDLRFYASTNNVQQLIDDQRVLGANGVPEASATGVLSGAVSPVGGTAGYATSIFGIPVIEVPLYPDNFVDLTFPNNRVWGFQRDVTVHREFQPKKDTVEYTVYVRFGVNIEEAGAVSYADNSV